MKATNARMACLCEPGALARRSNVTLGELPSTLEAMIARSMLALAGQAAFAGGDCRTAAESIRIAGCAVKSLIMLIELPYGRTGITIELPDSVDVVQGRLVPGLQDEAGAIREALQAPLGCGPLSSMVKPGQRVTIVHSDITRATPNTVILPVLLVELEQAGILREDITLLNGLGTHRRQTEAEMRSLLGDFVVDHYRCIQHDPYDDANLTPLGTTRRGSPVRINRAYMEADVRILTGFIEPHFFAGFSGGPKAVLPSIAGAESVATNHSFAMIGDPQATWGVTTGNPIWEEMLEVALRTRPTFLLNVALNRFRQISAVFAGDLQAAHAAGCAFVRENAMLRVEQAYDAVITTNSGYPLDQNLYQAVKGISAASRICRPGGAIVMLSACEDGLPEHGGYGSLLRLAGTPAGALKLLVLPEFSAPDQWNLQIQAQILLQKDVYIYSDGLSDEQICLGMYRPCRDIAATLRNLQARYGPGARLCVLPEGPQTVAYLAGSDI